MKNYIGKLKTINTNRFDTDYKMDELFSPAGLASQVIWKVLVIKMDDTTVALLGKSFKWVFNKGSPVLSHSLLLTNGSGNLREKRKVKEFKELIQT